MKVIRFVAPDRIPYIEGFALLSPAEHYLFSGDRLLSRLLMGNGKTCFKDNELPDDIILGNGLLLYRDGDKYFYPNDCKHCAIVENYATRGDDMSKMTHIGTIVEYDFDLLEEQKRYSTQLRETKKLWISEKGLRFPKTSGWSGNSMLEFDNISIINSRKRRHDWKWLSDYRGTCERCGAKRKLVKRPSKRSAVSNVYDEWYEYRGEKRVITKMPECTGEK